MTNPRQIITEHFTLEEMTRSDIALRHGIKNEPSKEVMENLIITCSYLELIRHRIGNAILILSGFRCKEVNTLAHGKDDSKHMEGLAVDAVCPYYAVPEFYQRIQKMADIPYDQLILEFNAWVHIGFVRTGKPRRELLIATLDDKTKKVVYSALT